MTRARPDVVLVTAGRLFHPRSHHLLARGLVDAGLDAVEIGQAHAGGKHTTPVPTLALPASPRRVGRMARGPFALLRALSLRPALLQINSLELLPWSVIVRAVARVPTIYDSREDYAAYMLIRSRTPARTRPLLSAIVARAEPWLAGHLDAVVTADAGTADKFRGRTRVLTVHNFPSRGVVVAKASDEAHHDVTYHGTVAAYHFEHIIATACALRDRGREARWCIAALEPSPSDMARFEYRLREAGLLRFFTLLHDVPHPEIPALVGASRIGFIPLPDELKFHRNIPMKLFEFLAAGRPAVVSDFPPIRRLVGDHECCLLVPPGDVLAYAEAIAALLSDPARASAMGERGRTLIFEELNAERELEPYVELCRNLIEGRRE